MIKASWKKLVLANYIVDPQILAGYLPYKTEFDQWDNHCFISVVGFMFLDTHILGIKFPYHIDFEEVNLRFYVKHRDGDNWKRGVVFIKEIVPLPGITLVANSVYKEHYQTMPMKHTWNISSEELNIEYKWKKQRWYSIGITTDSTPIEMSAGSEQMFFTDQHWGYTKVNPHLTLGYEVKHPDWTYYRTKKFDIDIDFGLLYGNEFAFLNSQKPYSVFLTEGSGISLKKSARIQ
ncbi:MAG TPA: DUF2071 domain-containing protein [Saprospiraceae bacterium]|nr:DUF2071 domain-containing protein [Saprospiraceae bacterium]